MRRTRMHRVAVSALLYLVCRTAAVAAVDGNAQSGVQAFGTCAACHSLRPDVSMTGPSLAGVLGRKAGSAASFPRYSDALAGSSVVWNEQSLDAWLADPARFIPGNRMTIRGIADPAARADLIALLREAGSQGPTGAAASIPEDPEPDLKGEPAARQVRAISYCGDTYRVTTEDGGTRPFWERNLRFETDQSARGPRSGAPVIMPAGMLGDRATVIFARPEEIDHAIQRACR